MGGLFALSAAASVSGVVNSPWLKDPPDETPPESGPRPNQVPINRSWDPGAFADTGEADNRTDWDRVVLAGTETPGIAAVKASRRNRLDRKETPGKNGETLTHLGVRSADVQVRIVLLTQGDLNRWRSQIVPLLIAPPQAEKTAPDPVAIDHPALSVLGIKSVYVEEIGVPQSLGPGAGLEVQLRMVEFVKTDAKVTTMVKSRVDNIRDNPPKPRAPVSSSHGAAQP